MPAATDAVWLDVLPNMSKFGPAMSKGATAQGAAAGKTAGLSFGKAALAATAVVAGGAALATKALYNIGATFDQVQDTIRVGTGATGDALKGLTDSAKTVATEVPASFDDVSTAIADLNTRLGLTGGELEDRSAQFLELSRITGTDLAGNIAGITRVFGDWGIETEDQAEAMDKIFRASQSTGIGVDALSEKVVQFGAPLRQMGFGFEESLAMFGKWEKEGVNLEAVMSGMRMGLGKLSKAGEDPAEAFGRLQEEIQGAATAGEANALAIETFGQRAGPDMAAAIREGRFELGDLIDTIENGGETIMDAGADTMDFSEQWLMFKNKVMVDLAPLAKRVFDTITTGMTWIQENGIPAIRSFGQWIQKNSAWLVPLAVGIGTIVGLIASWMAITKTITAVQAALNIVLNANPIGVIVLLIAGLVAALVVAYKRSETFRDIVDRAWAGVKNAVAAVVGWFTGTAWPAIKSVWDGIAAGATWLWNSVLKPAWEGIRLAIQVAIEAIKLYWNNVLKPVWNAIAAAARWLWNTVLSPVFGWIKAGWDLLLRGIQWAWNNVLKPAWDALQTAAQWMWNNVLAPVFRFIGRRWDDLLAGMRVVWETVLRPTFDAVSRAVGAVRDAVGNAVTAIGRAWDGLKRAFATPVNWVIDNVINKFLGWVNGIAKDMGLSIEIKTIPNVSWGSAQAPAGGGMEFHRGGVVGEDGRPTSGRMRSGERWIKALDGEEVLTADNPRHIRHLRRQPGTDVYTEIGDGPGILSRVKEIATAALNKAREAIVSLVRPGFSAAMTLMDSTVGQWGIPGQLAAGTARTLGDGMLDWMAGIEKEADSRIPSGAVPGGPGIGGGIGVAAMMAILRGQFPGLPLISGYRPGAVTATGNPSWHGKNRAVDIPPRMDVFNWLRSNYGSGSLELIFSPAGGNQIYRGRNHYFGEPTRGDHWDHIHWAYDQGGMLPPGVTQVANWTGKPEAVLTDQQWRTMADLASRGPQTVDRSAHLSVTYQGAEMTPARLVHTLRKTQLLGESADA